MDTEPGRGGEATGRVPNAGDGLRHVRSVRRFGLGLGAALALTLLARSAPALLQSEATWLERCEEILAGLPAEESVRALGEIYEELARDLEAGLIDPDRATALFLAADELAYLSDEARPLEATKRELYDTVRPVAHLILTPNDRATPALHVGAEMNRAGEFEAARSVLNDALERFPEAHQNRPYLMLELAETDRVTGSIAAAWDRIPEVRDAMARAQVDADRRAEYELPIREEILWLEMNVLLSLGLPDRYWTHLGDLEGLMGADHPMAIWYRARFRLATDNPDAVIAELTPLLKRVAYPAPTWTKLQLSLAKAEADVSQRDELPPNRAIGLFEEILVRDGVPARDRRTAQLRSVPLRIRAGDHGAAAALIAGIERERLFETQGQWLTALEARLALATKAPMKELERRLEALRVAYDEILATWASAPRRAGGLGFLHYAGRQDVVSELVQLTLAVEGPEAGAERALRDLMRARALGTVATRLRAGGERATLEEFRETVLAPGRGALVLLPGPERTHVFAIDTEGVVCAEAAPLARWSPLRRKLERELVAPPEEGTARASAARIAELAEQLSAQLLPEEIAARLGAWSELYVESAHLTGFLPFELLSVGGSPLGLSLPMAYLPSLNVGCLLARLDAEHAPRSSWDMVLVADPDGPSSEPDLPWTDAHAQRLRDVYGHDRLVFRGGAEAKPSVLTDPELMSGSVLQLVLHGRYEPLLERPSALVMAADGNADGLVRCAAIEALTRMPRLVVLAVCGASRGPLRSGDDGISNLGGAFVAGGATRVVLLSPYDMEFHATMELLDAFHERLRTHGDTPAMAMLQARRKLASDERYAHPFYHSMMPVVGLGHDALFEAEPSAASTPGEMDWKLPLGLLATVLAGAVGLHLVRRARSS